MTIFDRDDFNERLFFPRSDTSPPPPHASDHAVDVPGARLHLRIHRAPTSRATILLFHGNGEVVADYDGLAPAYARAGADLAVVDFRGYGASTGRPTLRAVLTDAHAVLDATTAKIGGAPLFVMGRSLGSACAAELYGARLAHVAGFVVESGSSDIAALVRRRGLPVPTLDDDERAVFDPIPKLRRGDRPLLVLHGDDDRIIAPSEASEVLAAAGTNDKTLVILRGYGHNNVSLSPLYWESLEGFVRARVGVAAT